MCEEVPGSIILIPCEVPFEDGADRKYVITILDSAALKMTTMKPKRTDDLTEREKENLSSYFSDVDADVFVISNLNPEVVGAALAR